MPKAREKEKPIRQSVRVDCPIEDAFQLFTEAFAEWWPLALYSIAGNKADTCVIEPWIGGRVFERSRSGEERDWGSVTGWDPPERLTLAWNPGGDRDSSQTVDVQFASDADGTQVTVIHTGWETPGVAVCGLETNCGDMWETLLNGFFLEFSARQMLALA